VSVVRRGVDRQRFSPGDKAEARRRLGLPAEQKVLLWVGRMVPVKGLDVLLKALTLLPPDEAPLTVLVGDGAERRALEAAARSGLPQGAVRFVGGVPHAELPSWYRAADLMVLPSRSEGVPNVLLEALACGTGFLASDVGSVRELASDPGRELVPAGDPVALASGIRSQIRSPSGARFEVPDSLVSAEELLAILRHLAVG
jgi:glycosyltransferase involved in cell wall biosynthesis